LRSSVNNDNEKKISLKKDNEKDQKE